MIGLKDEPTLRADSLVSSLLLHIFKCFKSLPFVHFQTAKDSYDQNDYRSLSIRVYFLNHFCFAYNIDPYVFIRALSLIEVLIRVLPHRSIDQSPHSCRLNDQSPTSYRNIDRSYLLYKCC